MAPVEAPPAEVPAQTEVSEPASALEAAPAIVQEPAPSTETEAAPAPFELDDDTLGAIVEVGGDRLFEHPAVRERLDREAQSRTDRALAERDATPDHDRQYQEYQERWQGAAQARDGALTQLAEMRRRVDAGDDIDVKQFGALTANAVQASMAAEQAAAATVSQAHRISVEATIRELFNGKGDLIVGKSKGADLALGDAVDNALRAYDSMIANGNVQAGPDLIRRAVQMSYHAGKAEGRTEGTTAAETRAAASAKLAGSAALTEVQAQAAAKRLGQTPPVFGGGATHSGPLTLEESQTLPINELIRRTQAQ